MVRDPDLVSIQEARELIEKAYEASRQFLSYTQEQVDSIVDAMAQAATVAAEQLAREAVEETGYGVVADKVEKNLLCSRDLHQQIRPMKTVGVLREDKERRILEIAVPVGVVAAVLPTTNPTSTAIYKILISLKGRNAIVLSPHPNAIKCICHTAEILYDAARKAGAPENVICCFRHPTAAGTQEMMRHRRTGVILSTGGTGIVKAAYSSGKPAFGVGPGNVPAFIERGADVTKAVADVVTGKTFDNGTLCSSEQAIVADESLREKILAELRTHRAHFLSDAEIETLGSAMVAAGGTINPKYVGKPAPVIAQMAGIIVEPGTRVLVAPLGGVGRDHPLSAEKLSPVLALYFVKDFEDGCRMCESILRFGGLGHTAVIHTRDERLAREFGLRMPAFRVVVNSPASHGSVGYTTGLFPSMTLGCGALGGNITGDNISPLHLINIKRVAFELRPVNAPQRERAAVPAATQAGRLRPQEPITVDRQTIQRVVERFLVARTITTPSPVSSNNSPVAQRGEVSSAPKVLDFVSESDVRVALTRNEKIFISPRTILTPSARDLAADHDVLVMTKDRTPKKT